MITFDLFFLFQNCESQFGGCQLDNLTISFVRNVAPHKDMMRATFPLTLDILTNVKESSIAVDVEPEPKKMKIVQ